MSMFLSFLGGGARQLTADIEKSEENAREDAKLGFSALTKRYEENSKANRELTSKMNEDALWVKTTYENATPDQINALVSNPVALEALKKTNDPYKIDLNNYIKIAQGNESPAVAAERIQALPSVVGQVADNMKEKMQPTEGRSPLGGIIKDFGQTSYDTTMERMAKSQGMSLADLQATSRVQRPTTNAKFNMAATEQPKDVEDIMKTSQLERFQAEQKFGKNSDQYKAANDKFVAASNELVRADKNLEDRRSRLEIKVQDNKNDPTAAAVYQKEIDSINKAILARKEATSTRTEREGAPEKPTYAKTKSLMEDYLNTQMTDNRGLSWRKFMEPKTIKDPDTGQVIVRLEKKVGLSPEAEKEVAEGMKTIRMQGLKELGLVTQSGAPRNPEVKKIITTYDLSGGDAAVKTTTPNQPLPVANATPSAQLNQARAEANMAISKGADRAAVAARFKQSTGQEL